ncbi:aminotransferase [Colletotrichum truncatum]|uniref:Aminotransferase n=1 Tax=Colletotrichum truncatum TaxID=5467 RepID=A0ACC3ZKE7_COLTU|nr:aminotransferase [Colletotrichum truncatum]KAF6799984.1 aminotransferase [Colletotrichum truncatum]
MNCSVTKISRAIPQTSRSRPLTHSTRFRIASPTVTTTTDTHTRPATVANRTVLHTQYPFSTCSIPRHPKMSVPVQKKKPINLLRGWPAPSLLPAAAISAAAVKTLADPTVYVPGLQYGPDPGWQPLREALAQWLSAFYPAAPATAAEAEKQVVDPESRRHHEPDSNRICITGGASQNLACILQSFTDPLYTQNIWMVAPCYFLACPIYADAGFDGRLKSVPEDDEGIDLEYLRKGLEAAGKGSGKRFKLAGKRKLYRHVIYLVPTCSNPTGKTMTLSRRYELVRLAREYDALIIADDVYDFLQWPVDSPPDGTYTPAMRLPRLVDVDRALGVPDDSFGNVVSNGSFSKIVGPGVRTGWAEGSPAFAYGLSQTGSSCSGGAPSQLAAMFMAEMLKSGVIQKHIDENTRPALAKRHKVMMNAVDEYILRPFGGGIKMKQSSLEGAGIYGGYFVWFSLPEGMSSREAAARAKDTEELIIGHGGQFEVHGDEDSVRLGREIRLCFSWEPEDDIVEGIQRLARVLKSMRDGEEWTPSSRFDVDNAK